MSAANARLIAGEEEESRAWEALQYAIKERDRGRRKISDDVGPRREILSELRKISSSNGVLEKESAELAAEKVALHSAFVL